MDIVKTTIRLTNVEEVNALLKANPQITVSLTEKAATQIARNMNEELKKELGKAVEKTFFSKDFKNHGLTIYTDQTGLHVYFGYDVEKEIQKMLKEAATKEVCKQCYKDVQEAYEKACRSAISELDISSIVDDAKFKIFQTILEKLDSEIKKGVLQQVENGNL